MSHPIICWACEGSGINAWGRTGMRCWQCGGRGRYPYQRPYRKAKTGWAKRLWRWITTGSPLP